MLDSQVLKIRLMGMNGFFAGTICAKLKEMKVGDFSRGQIYRVLKESGISLTGYRQGWSDEAAAAFKRMKIGAPLPEPPKKRKARTTRRKVRR